VAFDSITQAFYDAQHTFQLDLVDVVETYLLSGLNFCRMDCDFTIYRGVLGLGADSLQANKEKRGVIFKRAEKYIQEYRQAEREQLRLHRVAKESGSAYIPAEAKLIFLIRIKG
jgi:hypothetical protein